MPEQSRVVDEGEFYLTNLLRCGHCGIPMQPARLRGYSRMYRCPACSCQVDAQAAEAIVWEQAVNARPATLEKKTPNEKRRDALVAALKAFGIIRTAA